jgi:hypothetical protein
MIRSRGSARFGNGERPATRCPTAEYRESVEDNPRCSAQFRLSITQAFSDQLSGTIGDLRPAPLDYPALAKLEALPGVYQLYRHGTLVYVGKADRSVPDRLGHHLRKISGRQNIALAEMTFTCLYVAEDMSAVAPEKLLVKRYQAEGKATWNTSGFGGRDPGRRRDTTKVAAAHFDAFYPIDLDAEVYFQAGQTTMKRFLQLVKDSLPYIFRYDRALVGKTGLATSSVLVEDGQLTARQAFHLVLMGLPAGWQLSALPGRVILYQEPKPDVYDSALVWWRSGQGGMVSETSGLRIFDESAEVSPLENMEDYPANGKD